jgi:hypothetical protein
VTAEAEECEGGCSRSNDRATPLPTSSKQPDAVVAAPQQGPDYSAQFLVPERAGVVEKAIHVIDRHHRRRAAERGLSVDGPPLRLS